jgi:surfeit locus 1 family protein
LLIVLVCLLMAAVQFWRADVKHRAHREREAALAGPPIDLSRRHQSPADLPTPRVVAEGIWLHRQSFLLDNRTLDGRVGYHVITPLQLADGGLVLINRGWIAAPARRTELPPLPAPGPANSTARVEGWAVEFDTGGLLLGDGRPQGTVWPYLRARTYREVTATEPIGLVVQQVNASGQVTAAAADGLQRPWTTLQLHDPAGKHIGYAIMWLFFAGLAVFHGRYHGRKPLP